MLSCNILFIFFIYLNINIRIYFRSENTEEQPAGRDALYMTDPATDPENNLMQILVKYYSNQIL